MGGGGVVVVVFVLLFFVVVFKLLSLRIWSLYVTYIILNIY